MKSFDKKQRAQMTPPSSQRGSSLGFILIITMALGLIAASLASWLMTELRINERNIAYQHALVGAESALEYGAAQLASRFDRFTGIANNDLLPSNNPLTIPGSALTHFADSRVVAQDLEIRGGLVPPGQWTLIPATPANAFDPLRGRYAFVRNIEMYGRGTARTRAGNNLVNAYAYEVFQVRDAPLFGHAIFYNGTLEINPGFNLDVRGPVHANSDVYIGANVGATLTLHNTLSAAGHIYHDEIRPIHISDGSNVRIATNSGFASMRHNGQIVDSTHSDWAELVHQRWHGNVMDGLTGARTYNPAAIGEYVPDDFSTPGVQTENHAYAIIEPLLPNGHLDRKDLSVREQKMQMQAGLILRVEYDTSRSPGEEGYYVVRAYRFDRENNSDPTSKVKLDSNGDPTLIPVTLPEGVVGQPDDNFVNIRPGTDGWVEYFNSETTTSGPWWNPTHTTRVTGGFYDHREDAEVSVVGIDIGALRNAIDNKSLNQTDHNFDVDSHWNGVLYTEFPTSNVQNGDGTFVTGTSEGRNAYGIVAAANPPGQELALVVMNGGRLPNPNNSNVGFTLATNGSLYLVGHYNADGLNHTNSSTSSTVPDEYEIPAALIADTVTILSSRWGTNRQYSLEDNINNRSSTDALARPARNTEVAAAIMSGTPNTIPIGAAFGGPDPSKPLSLGVVNLPRFLEYWGSGRTLTIRGSLVSLYHSEIRPNAAATNFNSWYVPPTRNWGFSQLFAEGAFPPGTPVVRSYRRLLFAEIDRETYDAAIAALGN